jgi:hypothetical protein
LTASTGATSQATVRSLTDASIAGALEEAMAPVMTCSRNGIPEGVS